MAILVYQHNTILASFLRLLGKLFRFITFRHSPSVIVIDKSNILPLVPVIPKRRKTKQEHFHEGGIFSAKERKGTHGHGTY